MPDYISSRAKLQSTEIWINALRRHVSRIEEATRIYNSRAIGLQRDVRLLQPNRPMGPPFPTRDATAVEGDIDALQAAAEAALQELIDEPVFADFVATINA